MEPPTILKKHYYMVPAIATAHYNYHPRSL